MAFRKMRLCPNCETMGTYTNEEEWSRWKDARNCPACSSKMPEGKEEPEPENAEAGGDPLEYGLQVSINGKPVKVLRYEPVLVDVSGETHVPHLMADTGRRIIEVELPRGEPP